MFVVEESIRIKRRRNISIILLAAGIIFSQWFVMRFNLAYGFEFDGVKIYLLLPFFKLSNHSHDEVKITTVIVGYICYLLFLIFNYKKAKVFYPAFSHASLILCGLAVVHEAATIVKGFGSNFTREPLMAGWPLLLLCLVFFNRIYLEKQS